MSALQKKEKKPTMKTYIIAYIIDKQSDRD